MINDPTARDYSYVKTPVLDFLIGHELFRQELANMPPASEAPPPPKINASRRIINLLKKGPQMTTAIIAATGQRKTTALTMLHRMLDAGKVVRIGTMVFDGKQSRAVWWKLAEPK